MTQTLIPAPTTALTAVTESLMYGGTKLHFIPMETPEVAREEWPDAVAYVRDTCCTECGYAATETQSCWSCGVLGCKCLVSEQDHGSDVACNDCIQPCLGPCCDG